MVFFMFSPCNSPGCPLPGWPDSQISCLCLHSAEIKGMPPSLTLVVKHGVIVAANDSPDSTGRGKSLVLLEVGRFPKR